MKLVERMDMCHYHLSELMCDIYQLEVCLLKKKKKIVVAKVLFSNI